MIKKKLRSIVVVLSVLLLTGCQEKPITSEQSADSENDSTHENNSSITDAQGTTSDDEMWLIADYSSRFEDDVQVIKDKPYKNLDFSDCVFRFADCGDSIALLQINEPENAVSDAFSTEAYRQQIEVQFELFFPEAGFTDDAFYCNAESESEYYPLVKDCYDRLLDGTLPYTWFMYETDDIYAVWNKSDLVLPFRMSQGTARTLSGSDKALAVWLPAQSCTLAETYLREEITPELSYDLWEGTVSIQEAMDYLEHDYLEQIGCVTDFGIRAAEVGVFQVTPEIYGYNFYVSKTFGGVPFDMIKNMTGFSDSSDGKEYSRQMAEVFMIESDDVDTFMDIGVHKPYTITDEITEIVSLQRAVEIASQTMTNSVVFQVRQAELVYTAYYPEKGNYSTVIAQPEWKITAYNANDDLIYLVYVNAQNGEYRYQKQTAG